jgi:hypothetical protein
MFAKLETTIARNDEEGVFIQLHKLNDTKTLLTG